MVVDKNGRAFVGNFGYDLTGGEPAAPAKLVRVDPDGCAQGAGWLSLAARFVLSAYAFSPCYYSM